MRELWIFVLGVVMVLGSILTLVWIRTFERRTNKLGWADKSGPFGKQRRLQFGACVAAAIGAFVTVTYGLGMPPGAGRTSELGLIFILISIVWIIFRRDIAGYQYQIAMTMFNRPNLSRSKGNFKQERWRPLESHLAFYCLLQEFCC